ncbi:helix-turn-helix domain-containing protein [Desulfosporosinus sp. PR]|uniref:helix-turn-helix domain-containing protein n=1 Tax=Candidatus Desulfosporosinus nitrosoreducens TaxID=3401928 RepID=UPI0027E972C6|nr:helix-turn-helix domain-containing protein [Desulfosporosinus sp. PR]MDQ7094171.1 helix-turn-helix domain-containing protein [Desulfosporosinus sp. PR]
MMMEKELSQVTEEEVKNAPIRNITPVLLYPYEVAEMMKISQWSVYELVKRNKLSATKIGRGIRISMQSVMEFINSGGVSVLTGKEA